MTGELVPFAFTVSTDEGKRKEVEIREAPFVYTPNLIATVADTLSQHHSYVSAYNTHYSNTAH